VLGCAGCHALPLVGFGSSGALYRALKRCVKQYMVVKPIVTIVVAAAFVVCVVRRPAPRAAALARGGLRGLASLSRRAVTPFSRRRRRAIDDDRAAAGKRRAAIP